jgi:hypothetical protein
LDALTQWLNRERCHYDFMAVKVGSSRDLDRSLAGGAGIEALDPRLQMFFESDMLG